MNPLIKTELSPLVPDKIQHKAIGLARIQPKPAPQLLEKNGRAFRRPEEENAIHLRDVHPFVEEINGE